MVAPEGADVLSYWCISDALINSAMVRAPGCEANVLRSIHRVIRVVYDID